MYLVLGEHVNISELESNFVGKMNFNQTSTLFY